MFVLNLTSCCLIGIPACRPLHFVAQAFGASMAIAYVCGLWVLLVHYEVSRIASNIYLPRPHLNLSSQTALGHPLMSRPLVGSATGLSVGVVLLYLIVYWTRPVKRKKNRQSPLTPSTATEDS